MIDDADRRVTAFAAEATGNAAVWLEAPAPDEKRQGLGLYLLEMGEGRPPRDLTPAPLQLDLRYLVTAWAGTPAEEHKLLWELALAALEREDLSISFRPVEPALWAGFRIPPRAAFFLEVPLRLERSARRGPPVRETRTEIVPLVRRGN